MGIDKIIDLEALDYFFGKLKTYVSGLISGKQDKLVSGNNIKTVNGQSLVGEGDVDTGVATYVTDIIKGEKYNTSTGAIESAIENHYRTLPFATLGKFNAKFRWNLTENCTLTVHGWDTHGNYTGSVSTNVPAGTNEKDWFLTPTVGDAYYSFDFNTNDADASTIYVDITYDYATKSDIPTKVSQLTNDSNFATVSSVNAKANNRTVENISNIVWENSGSCEIQPNKYYIVEQLSGKTITIFDIMMISPTDTSIVNEYFIQFTTPSNGATLVMPGNIKWLNNETPILQPNKTYQLSIINNLAIIGVFG